MVLHAYVLLMLIDFMWLACADLLALGPRYCVHKLVLVNRTEYGVHVLCWTTHVAQQQQL